LKWTVICITPTTPLNLKKKPQLNNSYQ